MSLPIDPHRALAIAAEFERIADHVQVDPLALGEVIEALVTTDTEVRFGPRSITLAVTLWDQISVPYDPDEQNGLTASLTFALHELSSRAREARRRHLIASRNAARAALGEPRTP